VDELIGLDESLFLWINGAAAGPVASALSVVVTQLGNGLVLALLVLPILYLKDRAVFRSHALWLVVAVATSGLLVNVAKIAVDRPRPPERFARSDQPVHAPIGAPPDRSFPSGHTQTAFGTATYLSCLYPSAALAFLAAAALVGLSRVTLGVHFPSDVVVGGATGVLISLAVFVVARRRERRAGASDRRRPGSCK
jgi:undecaprenyl-diphosphatase